LVVVVGVVVVRDAVLAGGIGGQRDGPRSGGIVPGVVVRLVVTPEPLRGLGHVVIVGHQISSAYGS
jgi:hypothetical protein